MNCTRAMHADPSRARLRAFVIGSLILHGLVLAGWQASPWMAGQIESVLSVTLEPGEARMALAEIRSIAQPRHRSDHHAAGEKLVGASGDNNRRAPQQALLATAMETPLADKVSSRTEDSHQWEKRAASIQDTTHDDSQDAQNSATPSMSAMGEGNLHDRAKAQIQARLNADLARYFDYPYVARLRGWEGRVLLAFNIETDGRLKNIRVAQSSGFAVLDDSALNSLRQVEHLAEAVAWLRGHELAMQIPVIYRLRCSSGRACRENTVAINSDD